MAMALQEDELLTKMGSLLLLPRRAKETRKPRVGGPPCQSAACRLGESKSVGVGLTKPSDSCEVWLLRRRAAQAWPLRWGLFFPALWLVQSHSLLELPGASAADGDTPPLHEVERTFASLLWEGSL